MDLGQFVTAPGPARPGPARAGAGGLEPSRRDPNALGAPPGAPESRSKVPEGVIMKSSDRNGKDELCHFSKNTANLKRKLF